MNKQLTTVGYEIPGREDNYVDFQETTSLMDADVLLISSDSVRPLGNWVSFTSSDGGCYNVETSNRYLQKVNHLKKEIEDHLKAGKNVFVFLAKEIEETLSNGVSTPRKGQNSYSTYKHSNYKFLPINIGKLTSASGKHVQFSGNPIFSQFYNKFKAHLAYELYIEDPKDAQIIFSGKDKSKILGAVYKVGAGHLVTLPTLTFDEHDFSEVKIDEDGVEREFWNKKGLAFGNSLVEGLFEIDHRLASDSDKTPTPDWASEDIFSGKKEKSLLDAINTNNAEIEKIRLNNEKLELEVEDERKLKDLLFEQGKPLEISVIKALKILGYTAENYDDGDLEIDQIIVSPEGNRYIGETEGKDSRDINVTKFRQLTDALNADFAREEVEEKAFGILFGNAERLKEPRKRNLDFTDKCKSGAEREKIALVKTIDLYTVANYLNENKDENFMKDCREAIHNGLGKIIEFPKIPNK